jgi:hypothetical protein
MGSLRAELAVPASVRALLDQPVRNAALPEEDGAMGLGKADRRAPATRALMENQTKISPFPPSCESLS